MFYFDSLLSASEEAEAAGVASGGRPIFGRIVGGSVIIVGLYLSRLRNPLYTSIIGETETNLQLAESHAALSYQYYWDSRSANDSLVPRLKAMENYLGIAMTASQNSGDNSSNMYERVQNIRNKGYSNAVKVSLSRAEHYAEAGELEKFEETMQQTNNFISEGGQIDSKGITK